jgi:uncharacterized membrane-anchored protein
MLTLLIGLLVLVFVPFTIWLPAVIGFWIAGLLGAGIGAALGVMLTVSLSY